LANINDFFLVYPLKYSKQYNLFIVTGGSNELPQKPTVYVPQ